MENCRDPGGQPFGLFPTDSSQVGHPSRKNRRAAVFTPVETDGRTAQAGQRQRRGRVLPGNRNHG